MSDSEPIERLLPARGQPRRGPAVRVLLFGCWAGFALALALMTVAVILFNGGLETPEEVATGWATIEGVLIALTALFVAVISATVLVVSRVSPLTAGVLTVVSAGMGVFGQLCVLRAQGAGPSPGDSTFILLWGVVVAAVGGAVVIESCLRGRRRPS